jgi:hypothetical protein
VGFQTLARNEFAGALEPRWTPKSGH